MSTTHERAVSVAAAMSSAGQDGSGAQRRHLALERYVAAVAGDKPAHLHSPVAQEDDRSRTNGRIGADPTVSSVMSDAVSLPTTARFAEVLRSLAAHAVTAIPVVDHDGVPLGVVSEADLLNAVADDGRAHTQWRRVARAARTRTPADLTAADLMSSPAITTTPDASITQAATIAGQAHVKVPPVVDANGRVVGILSRAALLAAYLNEAERRPVG
jgi:CBS domain-containing protein